MSHLRSVEAPERNPYALRNSLDMQSSTTHSQAQHWMRTNYWGRLVGKSLECGLMKEAVVFSVRLPFSTALLYTLAQSDRLHSTAFIDVSSQFVKLAA